MGPGRFAEAGIPAATFFGYTTGFFEIIWDFAHHVRTDYAMLLTLLFLLIVGGGRWSADAVLAGRVRSA